MNYDNRKKSSAIEGMSASEAFKAMHNDPEILHKIDKQKRIEQNAFTTKRDGFKKIRELLNITGPLSIDEISERTNLPREIIKEYVREERLEIPKGFAATFICESCGARIRTGYLCSRCKKES